MSIGNIAGQFSGNRTQLKFITALTVEELEHKLTYDDLESIGEKKSQMQERNRETTIFEKLLQSFDYRRNVWRGSCKSERRGH